jgi:putative Ca2+/H+ antiporter (TMEM165/GDT1 family)
MFNINFGHVLAYIVNVMLFSCFHNKVPFDLAHFVFLSLVFMFHDLKLKLN